MVDEERSVAPAPMSEALEVGSLARELGREYERAVRYYLERAKEAPTDTDLLARYLTGDDADRVLDAPPDELSWSALQRAAERDPALAEAGWERIRAEARDELASGHRAAVALEPADGGSPWERARFLAIRRSFRREWQPRGGIEDALVDTLAQSYTGYLLWLARLTVRTTIEAKQEDKEVERAGTWEPPRQSTADAVDQAAQMADRFNRLFLRTLRALRDQRRYAPPVIVQNAGQVNVGAQQVNVGSG